MPPSCPTEWGVGVAAGEWNSFYASFHPPPPPPPKAICSFKLEGFNMKEDLNNLIAPIRIQCIHKNESNLWPYGDFFLQTSPVVFIVVRGTLVKITDSTSHLIYHEQGYHLINSPYMVHMLSNVYNRQLTLCDSRTPTATQCDEHGCWKSGIISYTPHKYRSLL